MNGSSSFSATSGLLNLVTLSFMRSNYPSARSERGASMSDASGSARREAPGRRMATMNNEQLRKKVGHGVRLRPIANRLDPRGYPLPQIDDEWQIESVTDDGVSLFRPRTGHGRLLAFDNICEYTKDRVERSMQYAFLTLKV